MLDIDKLYYIMDYSGNYYRVNDRDDLVIAKNTDEAAVFSFVEANKRLSVGHKKKFYFMTPIEDTHEEYQNSEEEESVSGNIAEAIISIARDIKSEREPVKQDKIMKYDLSQLDWQEYLTHFTYAIEALSGYRDSLAKEQSDVDLKICDILHYIELCDVTEEESACLVELIKECREHRREVKDEIFRIDTFQKNVGTSAVVAKAKEALRCMKGLETRKYTPRKLSELFDGRPVKAAKISEKQYEQQEPIRIKKFEEVTDRRENDDMEMIRKETAFDGKNNDWMAFAMQQAEFYRNAKQYIVNIKLDIQDIDYEIADLMDEIDNSNCNVAQGYKLFKRLKELRIQRKEKEQELQCLFILTERFDVDVMADECEGNAYEMESLLYPEDAAEEYVKEQETMVEEESIDNNISLAV